VLTLRISALFDSWSALDKKHKNDHWLDDLFLSANETNLPFQFEARSVH